VQGHSITYTLPSHSDPESEPVTITFASSPAASFVSLSSNVFTISPTTAHLGVYTITVSLSDGVNSLQNYPFEITVNQNTPPTFSADDQYV